MKSFWITVVIFFIYSSMLEYIALKQKWWNFNPGRIMGILILSIPVEEYLLFLLFAFFVIGMWNLIND